jgi:hypothetical protein
MPELILDDKGQLDLATVYQPQEKQLLLHTNPAKYLLAIGGGGSGKSFFLLGEALYTCWQYPGANVLLLRRDYPELEKGLILDFKSTVPKECFHWNDSKHIATFPNGSTLFFGHLQNNSERSLSQYLSSAFVFIGVDELGQFSYEAWSFLSWRNRINHGCQADIEGDMPIPRMAGATNPFGPGYGWIKLLWVDRKPVAQLGQLVKKHDGKYYQEVHGKDEIIFDPTDYAYVHSTVYDNPAQLTVDPDYVTKLMRRSAAEREKRLYGNLDSISGAYFQNFQYDRHVLSLPRDKERIRWEPWQPIWLGIDWGLAHATVVYWFTRVQILSMEEKWVYRVLCYREMVVSETGHEKICSQVAELMRESDMPDEIKRCRHIFLSPERFDRATDPDRTKTVGAQMGKIFHELGLPYCVRAYDRRIDGAVFCYNLLETGDFMLIEEQCPHLLRTIQSVVRDEKTLEDVVKSDSIEDDCYDAWRYGLNSMLNQKNKPQELIDNERIMAIEDPTARQMASYQLYLKKQERAKPHKARYAPRWMKR